MADSFHRPELVSEPAPDLIRGSIFPSAESHREWMLKHVQHDGRGLKEMLSYFSPAMHVAAMTTCSKSTGAMLGVVGEILGSHHGVNFVNFRRLDTAR